MAFCSNLIGYQVVWFSMLSLRGGRAVNPSNPMQRTQPP